MSSCRVFLVGEGPSDIGDLASLPSYRDPDEPREGFLQPILRTLVGAIELDFFDGRKLTSLTGPARQQPKHWLQQRKAGQALALALYFGADALVFSCDVDKGHGKRSNHERRKRLREIRASVNEGFEHVRRNQREATAILTVIAVPARMIEAWALGDRRTLAHALEVDVATLGYDKPEELWGDGEDPESDHPKSTWQRVAGQHVTIAEIGQAANPDVLRKECPDSFGAFAADVDAAVARCPQANAGAPGSKRRRRRQRHESSTTP